MSRRAPSPAPSARVVQDAIADVVAVVARTYPALEREIRARPDDVAAVARGTRRARDVRTYRRLASTAVADAGVDGDVTRVARGLRRFAAREKLRIAVREALAYSGQDVDVTARELSDLADVCCEVALAEALAWADARFGVPTGPGGTRVPFVVVGMGKLGGRELNAGSDVDLLLFYETDDGRASGAAGDTTLHEHFTRVAQRFVSTLDEQTEDGVVWRVDLRLRPEGSRGPLVNALAAAERYYETWGRTWERAALVRARPVAGDLRFGAALLEALGPFVWRRSVDPRVVGEMTAMLAQARAEAGEAAKGDIKIGPGGIREVEFFAQALQLVWGGREPRLRVANTLDALRRLRAHGFVGEGEERDLSDAYVILRRLEHRVQFATGLQTHTIPSDPDVAGAIARSLGHADTAVLAGELSAVRARVSDRFASLGRAEDAGSVDRLWAALDGGNETALSAAVKERFGASAASSDLPRHLRALARRPDGPLGGATRERDRSFTHVLVAALADSADPEQGARLLAAFFGRLATPGVYVRALAEAPHLLRALVSLLGASAFLGESVVGHPELVDRIVFARGSPTAEVAREQLREEVDALPAEEKDELEGEEWARATCTGPDAQTFVGALRRAKRRVTFEVGLADLAGEIGVREVAHVLTGLADATLDHALAFALRERPGPGAMALLAMGKLGGREIGYGSDLDLFFVFDADPADDDAPERFARVAQRVLRLVGVPHDEGPGYELDTRLRPSGSQGLLVVSVDAFARYQEQQAESWERQALVKARACAGEARLGARVIEIAHRAAYERGAPSPERMHHLRMRMERELGRERLESATLGDGGGGARYDVKAGRGGLVDVEFAVQWLQMTHGADVRVRTADTEDAIGALEAAGHLDASLADAVREGWRFLRRLEQRLRMLHGSHATLLEAGAPGLPSLARRVGMRDAPNQRAEDALLQRYVEVTREVRAAYLRILGLPESRPKQIE
jgi:glutamate-ammonia-ligase adenylyltransferase